ncbi:MAG: hypothetical protein Fur0032_05740 [Terrimicrobiaceae bacterium]
MGGGSAARTRALQIFEVGEDGGRRPLGKVRRFPAGTILAESTQLSSLLQLDRVAASPGSNDPPIPGVGHSYEYRRFRFRPDGSADLSLLTNLPSYHMTLLEERVESTGGDVPPNFSTVQIEPVTGATVIYRP